jgi:hypothetical protein
MKPKDTLFRQKAEQLFVKACGTFRAGKQNGYWSTASGIKAV